MQCRSTRQTPGSGVGGFTLIELVTVIVIMSILAVIGGGFMVRSADSYHQSTSRSQVIQQGRQAIERITRELRIAVPNSVRVSSGKECIEWLPAVAGGNYLQEVADQSNGAAPQGSVETAPLSISMGTARYVSIGALSPSELYGPTPGSLVGFGSYDSSGVVFASTKQFQRNSVNRRLYLADYAKQVCVNAGRLTLHEGYATGVSPPANLSGTPPLAGTTVLLSQGILPSIEHFRINDGSESRNAVVEINLTFSKGGEEVALNHQVMVRNVP